MKVLDGELLETQYAWPSSQNLANDSQDGLNVTERTLLRKDEVTYIHGKFFE